jgi:hypothetical protein
MYSPIQTPSIVTVTRENIIQMVKITEKRLCISLLCCCWYVLNYLSLWRNLILLKWSQGDQKTNITYRTGLELRIFSLQETEKYLIFLYFLLAFLVCSETRISIVFQLHTEYNNLHSCHLENFHLHRTWNKYAILQVPFTLYYGVLYYFHLFQIRWFVIE